MRSYCHGNIRHKFQTADELNGGVVTKDTLNNLTTSDVGVHGVVQLGVDELGHRGDLRSVVLALQDVVVYTQIVLSADA